MATVTDEQIIAEYKKTPNIRKICKKLGIIQKRTYDVIHKARHDKIVGNPKVKTLADFKSVHDRDTVVPDRIKKALSLLGHGGWEYEAELSRLATIRLGDLHNFRDKFADYVVELKGGRRAWAGSIALAKQMRKML